MAANARLQALFSIDARVRGFSPDAGDVDVQEAVQHVSRPARVVEGHHVRRVVENDVREITRFLVKPGRLALEGPVAAGGPRAGGKLETFAAIPFHVMDEFFCT